MTQSCFRPNVRKGGSAVGWFTPICWLTILVAGAVCAQEQSGVSVAPSAESAEHWVDIRALGVEGRGWSDTEEFFDRLPARARALVRAPV